MTSAPFTSGASGTDEHPDVAEISELTEGLLPPGRSADVRTHLADCPLCDDVRASLEEIRGTLGTLPGPPAMPADIAGRIDAALAAEALLDATGPASGVRPEDTADATRTEADEADEVPAAAGTGSTSVDPDEERRVSRETARDGRSAAHDRSTPLAPVSRETRDRPAGHGRAATGPGRNGGSGRPRRLRRGLLVTAGLIGVLGIGSAVFQTLNGSDGKPTAGAKNDAALKKQVHALLDSPQSGQRSTGPTLDTKQSPSAPDERPLRGTVSAVPSCVQKGIDRVRDTGSGQETPLATDEKARYEGGSGYLVVLPHHGGDRSRVDVYVVDSGCVGKDAAGPGDVLLQRTYPRN